MARMIPDTATTRVVFSSNAEERFYNACRDQLSDGWRVFYSVTLSQMEHNEGLKDNEADFVLYHPKFGVIVVEVKGGRIRYEAETESYFSINRHGNEFKIKNPFQQALVWKSRFVRLLRQKQIRVPVSYAVSFPTVYEYEIPVHAALEPEVVIGRERLLNLQKSLQTIAKKSHPDKFLQFSDVGVGLEQLLRGSDFSTRMYIRDYIDGHEIRVKDTEVVHETLITPIAATSRLALEGEAGTGKTMLAMLVGKYFRDQGKKVLLLTSNHLLNLYVQSELGTDVAVSTYTGMADSFGINLLQPPASYEGVAEDWIQYDGPDQLGKAIDGSDLRYDVLICDESQDVQPFWWEQLEKLLDSQGEKRFYIFFDRSQGVFGSGSNTSFIPEEVLPIPGPYFPLVHNYRTTQEIAGFAHSFRSSKGTFKSHSGRLGYLPDILVYEDSEDCQRVLSGLFNKLFREEGLRPEECTLLSARKPNAPESVISGLKEIGGYPLMQLADFKRAKVKPDSTGKITVSTIPGFKGLETPVGILMNVSEYNLPLDHPIMASLVYVASTRAKHMLYILVQKDDPKRAFFENAVNQIGSVGSLVIDAHLHSDYECVGTVVHYNPDRMGWISVEDQSFKRSKVMFFPHDVARASIAEVRVGSKLRFRPRIEGPATFAADLKVESF